MDERVAGALELLDEFGVASPSIGLTIAGAAGAAGVNRSTIYRHWPTAADLNTDLAVVAACHRPGWQRRILDVDPGAGIEEAVARSLDGRSAEVGATGRALAAGWPAAALARQAIAGWERAWLARLGAWAGEHVARHGRRCVDGASPEVLAVGLAATIEGWLVARLLDGVADGPEPAPPLGALGRRARLLLEQLTEPTVAAAEATATGDEAAASVGLAPLPGSTLPHARLALADQIIDACIDPVTGRWATEPARLVDLERLARRLDVSPRWLYELWPTAADMNIAVIAGWFERDRQAIDQHATAWLAEAGAAGVPTPADRVSAALDDPIRRRVGGVDANEFSLWSAAGDHRVRAVLARNQVEYRVLLRLVYLAWLSIAGWRQRPGIGVDEFTAVMFEANLGLDRLVALHPDLLDRELEIDGRLHPFCGGLHLLIGRSVSVPVDHA